MKSTRRISQAQEIEAVLEKRLQSFRHTDGRLPSETQLAAEFGVSRVTCREALSSLEQRGLIIRKPGLGTFVNRMVSDITTRLDECIEYGELIRRAGCASELSFLDWRVTETPEKIAEVLLVPPGAPAVYIRKVFTANGTPVIRCDNYIPLGLVPADRHPNLLKHILPRLSVYSVVAHWFEQRVTYQVSDVSARKADAETAHALGCAPGTALLAIVDVGFTDNQRPVFHGDTCFITDPFHFRLVRKAVYELEETP